MQSLLPTVATIKVSSTLDKSVGKKYLTDGSPETCWTSQQGIPQYIQMIFEKPVVPRRISITFQGGFVGTRTALEIPISGGSEGGKTEWKEWSSIFPEDVNRAQTFDLSHKDGAEGGVQGLKLVFQESSDFFGRITVYDLQLDGDIL